MAEINTLKVILTLQQLAEDNEKIDGLFDDEDGIPKDVKIGLKSRIEHTNRRFRKLAYFWAKACKTFNQELNALRKVKGFQDIRSYRLLKKALSFF